MKSGRVACVGLLGSAVAALSLLALGGGFRPRFGEPLQGLTPELLARFQAGRVAFIEAEDVPGGLGPVFNDTACANCHSQGAIGGGSDRLETRYGRVIDGIFDPLTQFDGTLVHAKGIGRFNGVDFVGEVVPPQANVVAGRRVNPLFGLGLVDAVPDQFLKDIAAVRAGLHPGDGRPGQCRHGRRQRPAAGRPVRLEVPDRNGPHLRRQRLPERDRCHDPIFPEREPPAGGLRPARRRPGKDRAQRQQRDTDDVRRFHHVPGAPTPAVRHARGAGRGGPVPRDRLRRLPSPRHADRSQSGRGAGRSRLLPLLGFPAARHGEPERRDRAIGCHGPGDADSPAVGARVRTSFLHDGRARTLGDAILAHDGQGLAARNRFAGLTERQKAHLLDFLDSL